MRYSVATRPIDVVDHVLRLGQQHLRGRHLAAFDIVAIAFATYAALAIRYERILSPADL